MKITVEQFKELLKMQKEMDELALKNNDIEPGRDLSQEKYLALMTELFEFGNEVEAFKFWKKNKGKANQLEELVDALHFILSIIIDEKFDITEDLEITEKQLQFFDEKTFNEIFIMTTLALTDGYMTNNYKEIIMSVLIGLMGMAHKQGFKTDDIINKYKRKNQINIERQMNKY